MLPMKLPWKLPMPHMLRRKLALSRQAPWQGVHAVQGPHGLAQVDALH